MRPYNPLVAVLILSACGGGGDVTPPGSTFTLTVSGAGSGAGRVSTPAGVDPPLDCALAAQPTGVCSVPYPEGTVVPLLVTPDASSRFDAWSGDAASCSSAIFCSITMAQDKAAVAELSPGTEELRLTSATFYVDPEFAGQGAFVWVFEVQNTTSQTVERARMDFTSHDASGTRLTSAFTLVGPIPPGETRANQGFADYVGTEASANVEVGEIQYATEEPNHGAAQIVSSDWEVDREFGGDGAIIWTVEVQNTTNARIESVQVDFSTYDSRSRIVGYDVAAVGPILPGERRSSTENVAELRGTEASAKFQIASIR